MCAYVCVHVDCKLEISLCVGIEAFLWAWGDVLQLPLFLHFDVLVGMHMTGILKVGPVCWENHEEVDLEEKGEVDGRWACQRCKASYRSQSYSTYITDIHERKVMLFFFNKKRTLWKKKCYGYCNSAVTIITNTRRYYLATHNTTEMTLKRWGDEWRKIARGCTCKMSRAVKA